MNTGETVDLFDGGWLALGEGLPQARIIVSRHPAPLPEKSVRVGKLIGGWVYELFITILATDGFLVEDVVDLYHGRGAFETVLADEDVEEDPVEPLLLIDHLVAHPVGIITILATLV